MFGFMQPLGSIAVIRTFCHHLHNPKSWVVAKEVPVTVFSVRLDESFGCLFKYSLIKGFEIQDESPVNAPLHNEEYAEDCYAGSRKD